MSKLDRAADTALQGAMDRAVARALHDWPNRKTRAEDARRAGSTARPARKPGKRSEAPRGASPAPERAFDAASFLRSIASDERDLSDEAGAAEFRDALASGPTGSLGPQLEDPNSLSTMVRMYGDLTSMHVPHYAQTEHKEMIARLLAKIAAHPDIGDAPAVQPDEDDDENEGEGVPEGERARAIAEGEAAERQAAAKRGANAGATDAITDALRVFACRPGKEECSCQK